MNRILSLIPVMSIALYGAAAVLFMIGMAVSRKAL